METNAANRSVITLAQVAEKVDHLEIACRRCDRRGRYSTPTLVRKYGPKLGLPSLGLALAADCPNARAPIGRRCSVWFPQIAALF